MMVISWLIYCVLVSALVSVAAWLAERGSRAQGWSGRWAWAGALAATVGFPLWAWLAPSPVGSAGLGPLPGAYVMETLPPLVLEPAAAGPTLGLLVLAAWAVASGVLLAWLGISALRLRAAERGWRAHEVEGVRVLVSERTGPAAMGLIRGRVVLPQWALELDARMRRLMVLHEAEHVRAGDPQLALAGLLVCALMPWNPAAWWQLRRLRVAIEMDCDARVLRRSGDVRGYGALLLEVGGRRSRLALGLAETRTSLERRIRMITMNTTGRRTLRALGLAAVAGVVLAVACETPGPTELGSADARPVELDDLLGTADGGAEGEGVVFQGPDGPCQPAVYVDGAQTTWAGIEAAQLSGDDIERIEVIKGAAAGDACGVILIRTKGATPAAKARADRLDARFDARVAPTRTTEELAKQPVFTPMEAGPRFRNVEQLQDALLQEYPPLLRQAGIGGTTNVWFLVDETGRVVKTMVRESSGYEALDQAALRVAARAEFSPATLDSKEVPVWIALDITFEVR